MALCTGDIVTWREPAPNGLPAFLKQGKIIGWYAQGVPIVACEEADSSGNTAFVCQITALKKVEDNALLQNERK